MMGFRLEKNELVRRLIKGVFETKPAFPKYSTTSDVHIVLKELDTWTPVEKLTLKEISMKLCMLIALLSGQRCQILQALNIDSTCMELSDKKCTFYVHSLLKHSTSGTHQAPTELHSFMENKSYCVVITLKEYLRRSKHLRNSNSSNLILTLLALHTPANSDNISRWLKWTLARAGVDNNVYRVHSTSAASTSAANDSGASINLVMKTAECVHVRQILQETHRGETYPGPNGQGMTFNQALRQD